MYPLILAFSLTKIDIGRGVFRDERAFMDPLAFSLEIVIKFVVAFEGNGGRSIAGKVL